MLVRYRSTHGYSGQYNSKFSKDGELVAFREYDGRARAFNDGPIEYYSGYVGIIFRSVP